MPPAPKNSDSVPPGKRGFASTRWTLVLVARGESTESKAALATLCETYWPPLYTYLRRRGYKTAEAEDLTQGFFARLLEKNFLREIRPERGKFRSFLLASLKHFLANEYDRSRTAKRGGGRPMVPIDVSTADSRYGMTLGHQQTPERAFDRQWALTVLERVQSAQREEYVRSGRIDRYERLQVYLSRDRTAPSYSETAAELRMSEGAVKTAVHRLRQRFRELLRSEIAQTVSTEQEIDDEIRSLFTVLGG